MKQLNSVIILIFLIACGTEKTTSSKEEILFPIYSIKETKTPTIVHSMTVVDQYISIEKQKSISEKVNILLQTLSSSYFDHTELELLETNKNCGYSILKINLKEDESFADSSIYSTYSQWYRYFQGSTGGNHTAVTLKETLLQRFQKEDWVDGIIFYWNNKPYPPESNHTKLYGLFMRIPLSSEQKREIYHCIIKH